VYQYHITDYVVPFGKQSHDGPIVGWWEARWAESSLEKQKGGVKRLHLRRYVIQAQYGLGNKCRGCRGSAEDDRE
jgi:hypothetical protein